MVEVKHHISCQVGYWVTCSCFSTYRFLVPVIHLRFVLIWHSSNITNVLFWKFITLSPLYHWSYHCVSQCIFWKFAKLKSSRCKNFAGFDFTAQNRKIYTNYTKIILHYFTWSFIRTFFHYSTWKLTITFNRPFIEKL